MTKRADKVGETTESLLFTEDAWGTEMFCLPGQQWYAVAPGVQIRRVGCCTSCMQLNQVAIRVHSYKDSCCELWQESPVIYLDASWKDIAPGVQVRKPPHWEGVTVRHLQEPPT